MRPLLVSLVLAVTISGCAGATKPAVSPADLPIWLVFDMRQDSSGYVWQPVSPTGLSQAACAAFVREQTQRGSMAPVGMVGWYPFKGQPAHWLGCFPVGYDPYAPR